LRPILKSKKLKMKKFLAVAAIATFMVSCSDAKKEETTVTTADSVTMETPVMSNQADSNNKMMDQQADTSKMDKMTDTSKMDKGADKMEEKKY
jgi:hypothetical protein